jgi:RHS repeat-associated protein
MAETPFGFTGEWRDGGTGMYYLRARYYAPGMGTFVSRDPFEGIASRAMSLNGYSWVEGRVADGRDPSGITIALANAINSGTCSGSSVVNALLGLLPVQQATANYLNASVTISFNDHNEDNPCTTREEQITATVCVKGFETTS